MSTAPLTDTLLKPIMNTLQSYYRSHKTAFLIALAIALILVVLCFSNRNNQPDQLNLTPKYAKIEE